MLSGKPLWHYYHFRTARIAAMDVALAVALTAYTALALSAYTDWNAQYGIGAITGVVLLRARDAVAHRLDGDAG